MDESEGKERLIQYWNSIDLDHDSRREFLVTHEYVNGYWLDTSQPRIFKNEFIGSYRVLAL